MEVTRSIVAGLGRLASNSSTATEVESCSPDTTSFGSTHRSRASSSLAESSNSEYTEHRYLIDWRSTSSRSRYSTRARRCGPVGTHPDPRQGETQLKAQVAANARAID